MRRLYGEWWHPITSEGDGTGGKWKSCLASLLCVSVSFEETGTGHCQGEKVQDLTHLSSQIKLFLCQ